MFYWQAPERRNGTPNRLHAVAPGWTSLYWNGKYLIAKPIDICKALDKAIENLDEYNALEITLVDGDSSKIITLDELEAMEVKMLPPPTSNTPGCSAGKRRIEFESEIDRLKAELAEARSRARARPRRRPRASEHVHE